MALTLSIALVSDTGSSSIDRITSNPVVKGVGQANTLVIIKDGGTTLGIAVADATGAWSFIRRLGRRGTHADCDPDRFGRQYRDGDAELHARQDGAGGKHGAGFGHRQLVERQDYLQPGRQRRRSGQTLVTIKEGGARSARRGRRHGGLELYARRIGRRRAYAQRQPDRSGRQHRNGDAELHARQSQGSRRRCARSALVSDTGSSASDKITSNPRSRASVRPNAGQIKEGGTTLGTTTADGTGAWSFTPAGLDRRRAHANRQPDRSGRQHRNGDAELTLDRAAPAVSMALVSEPAVRPTTRSRPTRRSRVRSGQHARDDQGGRRRARHDDGRGTGAWSFTPAGLADGAYYADRQPKPISPATPGRRR